MASSNTIRGPELYAFARRLGLSSEAAEDAVQEALMRLWMATAAGDQITKPDSWSCPERIGAEPRQ